LIQGTAERGCSNPLGQCVHGAQRLPRLRGVIRECTEAQSTGRYRIGESWDRTALQKNYPDAEQFFVKAHQTDPKSKSALISLLNYYRATRNISKAEPVLKDGLATFPTDREIYTQAVQYYIEVGRFDQVQNILQEVQHKSAGDPTPSLMLADFYMFK